MPLKCFFIVLLFFSMPAAGQVNFSFLNHDFGELHAEDDRFVDVILTNNSNEKVYILRIERLFEVTNRIEKDLILPGEAVKIRFQVNPKKLGKFNYEVPVFTSNQQQPTVIRLSGTIKEQADDLSLSQDCPDFFARPSPKNATDFVLTILTIDAQTKKTIGEVGVIMLQNGRPLGKIKTDAKGQVKTQIPLGITYFYAKKEGYNSAELAQYVNFKRNKVIIELDRITEFEDLIVEEEISKTTHANLSETIEKETDTIIPIEPLEKLSATIFRNQIEEEFSTVIAERTQNKLEVPSFENLDTDDFNENDFKPINLVFVIDVSSSMRQQDRLELLKYSLYQLVDMLRPIDQMGLVAYATSARVLLPVTKGDDKEAINEIVEKMKASGLTAGAEGIMLGFKQVRKNFMPDAHNQVIVITDGAFNKGVMDYEKRFKRYVKRGITLSVVGIKNNEKSKENMQEVADIGQGEFIEINGLIDAQENLKQMIRFGAFKH